MLVRREAAGFGVYMARRSSRSRFMPDAYVFPGGAVDAADAEPRTRARLIGNAGAAAPELAVAALRELLEEAGVLLACDAAGIRRAVDPQTLAHVRAGLAGGAPFTELLESRELWLAGNALAYYSNWITPEEEPIRFDAHFFVAIAPPDQVAAADALEMHDGLWISPAQAIERADRSEMTIRFPTQKHLERLAAFDDVDALFEHARTRQVRPVMPVLADQETLRFEQAEAW